MRLPQECLQFFNQMENVHFKNCFSFDGEGVFEPDCPLILNLEFEPDTDKATV